jgi:NhaP-type Na+/H+ or K+/H+ antiporter
MGLLQAIPPATEAFTETLSLWMNIDPHLLLLIFVPTIGVSAGINQEPHLLRKNWGQILILAGPGVVIKCGLIAVCAMYFFPYGWSWSESLLFGAMLSATDPVAVVAVLHEVGADKKLSSVIDGESLVNDGSALVIFLVLQQFVQGNSLDAGEIIALFCRLALLGGAVGGAFGAVTSWWLSRIWRDPGLDIILTWSSAYACYYVAEDLLGASGLLAVVFNGFTMSLIGGRQLTRRFNVQMHAFWDALEWAANTILFIWVGVVLGLILLPSETASGQVHPSYYLEASDVGYAVVLYLWLLVARFCSVFAFYPLLCSGAVGYPLGWRQALVMVWAGLRGAVGVAMSLFIFLDPLIIDAQYKAHCLFFMAVMAFSTVIINGSTTKYLLRGLGLLKKTHEQIVVMQQVVHEMMTVKASEAADPVLGAPDPRLVARLARVDMRSMITGDGVIGNDMVREYRRRLLQMNKANYGLLYDEFSLNTHLVSALQEATDRALDDVDKGPLSDWTWLLGGTGGVPKWVKGTRSIGKYPGIRGIYMSAVEGQVVSRLRLVSAFVTAHQASQKNFREHLDFESGATIAAYEQVLGESIAEVTAALEYVSGQLVSSYGDLPRLVVSWKVAVALLREQEEMLERAKTSGLLTGEEAHQLGCALSERLKRLMHNGVTSPYDV